MIKPSGKTALVTGASRGIGRSSALALDRPLCADPWGQGAARSAARAPQAEQIATYKDNYSGCHTDAGTGVAQLFPRLAGSRAVQSDDATTLIRTVLFGSRVMATAGGPALGPRCVASLGLTGLQVAAVITYIRNSFGNAAATVSSHQVSVVQIRQDAAPTPGETAEKSRPALRCASLRMRGSASQKVTRGGEERRRRCVLSNLSTTGPCSN